MGRLLALSALAAAAVAVALAGIHLTRVLRAEFPEESYIEAQSIDPVDTEPSKTSQDYVGRDLAWLPIFGSPQTTVVPDTPEQVPRPPSFDFALKGIIASGDIRWAILSGPDGDLLVQEGDVLDDARIVAIRSSGLDVEIDGTPVSVTFSEGQPVQIASIQAAPPESGESRRGNFSGTEVRPIQEVLFQDMTREEIMEVVRKAEEKRRERGWIPAASE